MNSLEAAAASLTEAEGAAKIAAQPTVLHVEGIPHLVMPQGWQMQSAGHLMPCPPRKMGTLKIHEADSFIEVVKRYGSLADCNIYLDVNYATRHIQATAVFNDHADGVGEPGWRDHRAVFNPRMSEEWTRWTKNDRQVMEQAKLAHFLEENIADIVTGEGMPNGSDILTFVAAMQETRKVKYGSAVNLQNGMVQIEFIEDGDHGTKGKLDLFRQFAIGVRPFAGGDAYQIKAFLRYRIDRNNGSISFWYELQRADRVLEDASRSMVDKIKTATGLPVIFGTAE
jgi:uncharacterized protein YfdQ (DUF2303 family)